MKLYQILDEAIFLRKNLILFVLFESDICALMRLFLTLL